jgi:uncharacterized protein YpmB
MSENVFRWLIVILLWVIVVILLAIARGLDDLLKPIRKALDEIRNKIIRE